MITRRLRLLLACSAVTAAALISSCTASDLSDDPTSSASAPSPLQMPEEEAVDEFSPLIVSSVAGDPVPVRGTDGLYHLVYELQILNSSPRPAAISSITSSAGGDEISMMTSADVIARTLPIGDYPFPPEAMSEIPAGTTAVVLMDTTFESRDAVPGQIDHELTATFGEVRSGQANYATLFPTEATAHATTRIGAGDPVVVGPPLTGADWVAVNACCSLSPHRGTMIPIGGRINAAERYAIDWSRFDLSRPLVENGEQSTFAGDPTVNANYYTYDQPVLAVAEGEVAVVVDDLPDAEPHVLQEGLPLSEYGGNHIVLKIADGVYAFYAHLKPGSVTVQVGDHVRLGDEIARTGNSGNTTESHLHFHLMDGTAPLTATNLPFEISSFTMQGNGNEDGSEFVLDRGQRENELPLILSGIGFPD